jgi:hypothetical protein
MGEVVERPAPIFGESRQLDALDDPHLVTARDTARVLLKKGMSPDTKINARLTPGTFAHAPEETPNWTLRELANLDFSLTDLGQLNEEAGIRGMKAIPKGRGIILESFDGSYRKEFSQQLEAVEAVGRMPLNTRGNKIEQQLEKEWGFGFERSFDADVDADIYRPVEFMKSGIDEVVAGRRPLVTVFSGKGENLAASVDGMARAARLDPNAFQVVPLGVEARGRTQYAIFNTTAVKQNVARYAPALKHLGIDFDPRESIDVTLGKLAAKPHGLGFLYGGDRDPMDALLYTHLRMRGDKELWTKAEVTVDSLGPYRQFTQSMRDTVKARGVRGQVQQAMPEAMGPVKMPQSSVPEGPSGGVWRDLKDEVDMPSDFYFTEADGNRPPPMAEPTPEVLTDQPGLMSSVLNRFRIPSELFKSLEQHTKIPFYQWYSAIEGARGNVEAATKDSFGQVAMLARHLKAEDRKRVQLLLETKHGDKAAYPDLLRSVDPRVAKAADDLEGIYTKFFQDEMGHSPEEVHQMLGNFPQVRRSGKDYKIWVQGQAPLPRPMVAIGDDLMNGTINLDERDMDFSTLARRTFRAAANEKHMRNVSEDVKHALGTFSAARGSSTEFTQYFDYFNRYYREAMHQPDGLALSLNNMVQKTWKKIFGKDLPDDESVDLVSTLTSFNFYANMGFQVGMVGRNYLQTLQTTYPTLGGKYTADAIRFALKWRKDKALQDQMIKWGVIGRDAYIEPMRDIQRMLVETNAGSKLGDAPAKVMDALQYGVSWYQSADNFNKVVAWKGQFEKAKDAGKRFLDKKISWAQYAEESGAEMRIEGWDTGLGLQVKEAIADSGDVELASALLANDFSRASQFQYTRGNVPNIMQSTAGRLFGQYGTWPAYYIEFLQNGLRRGSPKTKVKFASRWVAANAAILYGGSSVFGADMGRWTFFAPTSYTGGPVAQFAQQAMSAYGAQVTGEDDPVARIQASRLSRFAATQVLPVPVGAIRNYSQALDALSKENYGDATRRFLGLPKQEP